MLHVKRDLYVFRGAVAIATTGGIVRRPPRFSIPARFRPNRIALDVDSIANEYEGLLRVLRPGSEERRRHDPLGMIEVDSEVRRIVLDGREPPEFYPHSQMGFSTGYWDGSDLVINTILLQPNVRDFRGEPISENARLEEIYSLSEDGQTLTAVIKLHDPENYKRPPIRRRKWTRNPDTEIFPYECDPDSFYRQMYNEGLLDMYFERSRRRL